MPFSFQCDHKCRLSRHYYCPVQSRNRVLLGTMVHIIVQGSLLLTQIIIDKKLHPLYSVGLNHFLTRQAMNTGWRKIDIYGCYSLVKIDFGPICKNNRRIWRHNASTSRSRDVTDQLWWCHNAESEKTGLGDNGEMSEQWLILWDLCAQDKIACKKNNNVWVSVNNDFLFCHSRRDTAMIFTRDFVTRENHCGIVSLVTKTLFTLTQPIRFSLHIHSQTSTVQPLQSGNG